ncbi:hypothetical protein GCM10028821_09370 [Hymenobacter jeollabukensis]
MARVGGFGASGGAEKRLDGGFQLPQLLLQVGKGTRGAGWQLGQAGAQAIFGQHDVATGAELGENRR